MENFASKQEQSTDAGANTESTDARANTESTDARANAESNLFELCRATRRKTIVKFT